MEISRRLVIKVIVICLVAGVVHGYERRVSRSLISTAIIRTQPAARVHAINYARVRRDAPPFPKAPRDSNDQFIPRIEPAPPGSILTYDGKPLSTSIGAFNIVPKSERKTPSINLNRPQYATYRGDLPPPIPDIIPSDLPQFKNSRSVVSSFPPGFQN